MSSEREGNRWLRHHFHEFVFPAFMAAEKKTSEIGKPFNIKPSPQAPELLPTELKKLWTLCMELEVPWVFDVRERNLHSGSSKYRESARIHHKILQNTINSSLAALRDEGCDRLFFGGRDVWTFAVLCSRRRIPYLFVPELSRNVSGKPAVKPFLESLGFTGQELFLDTGFAGSIPRSMQAHWADRKFKFRLMSQGEIASPHGKSRYFTRPNQLFPNRAKAREEALQTEYLSKYWRAGTTELLYPEGCPLVAPPTVAAEWKNKTGVRRFSKPRIQPPTPGYWLGLWDGKEAILVGISDHHLAPGFYDWWLTLPEEKERVFLDTQPIGEKVVQYFSDRQTIQRAALLTSMLWRGIPYWKAAMHQEKKAPAQSPYTNAGQAIQFHQQAATGLNTINHGTQFGNAIYTIPFESSTAITGNVINATITGSTAGYTMTSANVMVDQQKALLQQMVMQAAASMAAQSPVPPALSASAALKALPPHVETPPPAPDVFVELEPIQPTPIILLGDDVDVLSDSDEMPVITLDAKDIALLGSQNLAT